MTEKERQEPTPTEEKPVEGDEDPSKGPGEVEEESADSFPASDPPSW